jgi:hypothetical protein
LNQVGEKRNPRSRATMDQLIDKYLTVLKADPSTRRGYESKIRTHIRPLLGSIPLTRVTSSCWIRSTPSFVAAVITATAGRRSSTSLHDSSLRRAQRHTVCSSRPRGLPCLSARLQAARLQRLV